MTGRASVLPRGCRPAKGRARLCNSLAMLEWELKSRIPLSRYKTMAKPF
jgi:hypothetical protein